MTREWLDQVASAALGYRESLEATYDLAMACLERDVPGDFVECGVFAGAHCAVMARAILDHFGLAWNPETHLVGPRRRVHLFDSFCGLPAADERDTEIHAVHGTKPGEAVCSLQQVVTNMETWGIPQELLVYHAGWLDTTCEDACNPWDIPMRIKEIALLRMDADLYKSTAPIMKHLYPLVSRGGWVIVDDWNLAGCREAVNEVVVPAPIYWRRPEK